MPAALSIGVGYDTFWRLNPRLLKAFIKADRIKKRQTEIEMYIAGRYVFDAVSLALANGFRQKGKAPEQWLEEPYRMLPFSEEEETERAAIEREKAIAFFNAMIPKNGGDGRNG